MMIFSARFFFFLKARKAGLAFHLDANCKRTAHIAAACVFAIFLCAPQIASAEAGHPAWLRYDSISDAAARHRYDNLPAAVVTLSDSEVIVAARQELIRGVRGMLGRTLRAENHLPQESAIVLGTFPEVEAALPGVRFSSNIPDDGYILKMAEAHGLRFLIVTAANERGVLYGAFALLRKISLREPLSQLDVRETPFAPLRWVNEWDNLDGTIERGYGGRSIFFEDGHVLEDLTRASDYARLLASMGINGCAVNNVNANAQAISTEFLPQLARIAQAFAPWGVKLAVSIDLGSPKSIGGLDTYDPLDPRVGQWWIDKFDEIYRVVPNFGGAVLKADSEGRAGPSSYGRTPVDAANVIARALKPHGGVIFYRAFVYDHHLDWTNLKNDRARAAYDIFHPLDGQFEDNVVVQIKNGPIDFQVREPASPLLGDLRKTNEAMELQITQEYMGQQRHLCFLVPIWKQVLDFDMHANGASSPVKDLIAGKTFHRPLGGMVGVSDVGRDSTWLGSNLSMANLYGFGRLAWNPNLSAKQIADEWTRQTFGNSAPVVSTIADMQLKSWRIYENYTGPLGVGTLTDILGSHYGPNIEAAERNGWGQWIRANQHGIGMDRTVAIGTGFIGQYAPAVAKIYESLATCPDELLLFMHHVPYSHVLHSGKTVIQYVYDSHYEGAEEAAELVKQWQSLRGLVDDERYAAVLRRLEYQAGHAIVWRDAICNWFMRMSGIPDAKGHVGVYPGRIEAESMKLSGYKIFSVKIWETSSGGQVVTCVVEKGCAASFHFEGKPGWHDLSVEYFDQNDGESRFKLFVAGQMVDEWTADDNLPAKNIDGNSSTRRTVRGVALRPGDEIRIEGIPDREEFAPLDYLEIK
jgi:alpha-glucuronidase